uniref:Uncharacterized protein n=1 Tax=Siphoviridae sp. ctLqe90 TaxID=2825456 RepID=A0A8S5Q3F7_9CAUD|nr:MAG TPA: hypothetical protein [Siphoviridae sp. ctLqe90]DAG36092.1 MAG TPA: hypothetical protein [Caudoviricetes sp.]
MNYFWMFVASYLNFCCICNYRWIINNLKIFFFKTFFYFLNGSR